jgi:hypothetical protein
MADKVIHTLLKVQTWVPIEATYEGVVSVYAKVDTWEVSVIKTRGHLPYIVITPISFSVLTATIV